MFMVQSLLQIFGLKRRAKVWGTVYDAKTKHPIPFARVELRDQANRSLEVRYADRDGRYGFLTSPTSVNADALLCSMVPSAKGYVFPSALVTGDPDFIVYNHVYRGGQIVIRADQLVNFNIPLDPVGTEASAKAIRSAWTYSSKLGATVMDVAFWIGLIVLPLNAFLHPSLFTLALLVMFVAANALRIGTHLYRPYGIVRDGRSGEAMPYALVTLNEMNGSRVAFAVSDERGRYFLLATPGSYLFIVNSPAQVQPPRSRSVALTTRKGWITQRLVL